MMIVQIGVYMIEISVEVFYKRRKVSIICFSYIIFEIVVRGFVMLLQVNLYILVYCCFMYNSQELKLSKSFIDK